MWAALGIAVAVGIGMTLVGCSGRPAVLPGSSPAGSVAGASAQPTRGTTTRPTADTETKAAGLTGDFCADYKNIGKKILVPSDRGSLSVVRQRSARYLRSAAAYYDGLASEVSSQAGTEFHVISSANLTLANLISTGKVRARSQIKLKMLTLTSKGSAAAAAGRLVVYVATRCG